MAHLVITIGCEYGAKGNMIGRKVAKDLGIKFYDRDTVDKIIKEVGIPKDIMEKVEEGGTIAGKGAEGDVRGSFSKYADLTQRAIHVQKTIIRKLADRESCVIIGRCADYALADYPNVVSVFITADEDVKIRTLMERHKISESQAKDVMIKTDKKRASYYNYYSSKRWGDSKSYDLCMNSSKIGYDGVVKMIQEFAKIKGAYKK